MVCLWALTENPSVLVVLLDAFVLQNLCWFSVFSYFVFYL